MVEILSPSTANNDLHRMTYERFGVQEYWIVDPENHNVTQLVLKGATYGEQPHDGNVQREVLPQVQVDFSKVW